MLAESQPNARLSHVGNTQAVVERTLGPHHRRCPGGPALPQTYTTPKVPSCKKR